MKERTSLARWTPRRLLSLLMAFIMTLSLLPTAALAATPDSSKFSITFDAPERMVVGTEYTNAKAEVTIGSFIGTAKLTAQIDGHLNGCTIGYDGGTITNSDTDPHDLANLGTASTSTQALHVEPISLKFTEAGEYKVTLAVVNGSTTETSVTKTFYVSDITSPTAPITPISAVEGEPFDVTVNTSYPGNSVFFEYGTETQTVQVSARPDGTGYATAHFTAKNATPALEVKATLFNPGIPGFSSGAVTIPVAVTPAATPATSHTVTFLAGAADAYIPFVATATVANGDNYTIPAGTPTRKGYTFGGWTDGAHTYPADDTILNVTSDIVLSAKWTATPVKIVITNAGAALGVDVTNPRPNSSIGSEAHFTVKVPVKYNTADLLVFAGDLTSSYIIPVPVARVETADGVMLYYQFTVTEDLVDPATSELNVTVSNFIAKSFTVMMPTGHFNAEITGATPASPVPPATGVGSTVADDKKSASIVYGGSYTFTVKPHKGYDVEVYVNGVKKDAATGNSYTVTDVTGPQRVEVVESAIPNYNVTFTVPQSGELFTQTVMSGGKATKPAVDPIREGYTFEGWYTATEYKKTNGDQFNFTTETITEDTVLYGKLTPKTYIITYDGNGSDGGTVPTPQPKTHGTAIILSTNVPTRTGYTFLGWGMTSTATAANYQPGDPYSVDGHITLYAVWQKNTYTITFSSGEGYSLHSIGSMTVAHGDPFEFNLFVDPAYAQKTPTVYVNTGTISATVLNYDSVNDSPTNDGAKVYHYKLEHVTANTAINAEVTANTTYTVTFMTGTDVYQTQQVEFDHKATQPVDPKVEGFTFDGWYKETTPPFTTKWNFATDTVTTDTTLHAKLDPIIPKITWPTTTTGYTMKVEYTAPGAATATPVELTTNPGTVPYNSVVTFTITISKGYDASKMQVGINGVLLSPKSIVDDVYTYEFTAKQDTEITVVGVERKTVTIIYNDNGGYGGPVQETVNYFLPSGPNNGEISETVPKREGYDFLGWAKTNGATVPAYSNPAKTDPVTTNVANFTSDTVLYAVWQAKETGIKLEVSNTIDDTATLKAQYEGEDVTLTATVTSGTTASVTTGSVQFYRCTDADPTATTATWTLLNSAVVSGGTAIYTTKTSDFVYGGTNKDTYKAVFIPTEGNGYTKIESATEAVTVKSTAISWKLDATTVPTAPKIDTDADANVLTIKDKTGTTVDSMVAGQVYTLELPAIYALDEQGTPLTVNKDYSVTWQYRNDKGVWTDYTNSGSGNTTTVDAAYSQYVFRAVVTPVTGATSHFTKAAKYTTVGALEKDKYETVLISEPTTEVDLQKTTTKLEITGADNEAANVTINGATDVFTADHLAQFEGKKVTLTATVTDTTTHAGVKSGEVKFFRYVDGTKDELLNTTLISVDSNGVATCEVEISNWTDGDSVTDNKDEFYAVYLANATYDTSASWTAATAGSTATGKLEAVYIKSTEIAQPVLKSDLPGKRNATDANTTAGNNLTELLAGVQHTFSLVETGAQAKVEGVDGQFSVVAKDGRTVDAKNYTVEWLKTTGSNEQKLDVAENIKIVNVDDNKVGDKYRIKLIPQNDMKVGEVSNYAIIGKKQDVTVTVEASADWVYQLNEITLTATVAAKETSSTMKPTGTVTFYYSVDNGTTWTKIGDTKDLAEVAGVMTASIKTDQLPVKAGDNTKQEVKITAVYEGNETFKESATATATGASHTIAATPNCTTNNKNVTVYSSVVYVKDTVENKTVSVSNKTHESGIYIYAEDDKVLANEGNVNLKLSEVYTLDHDIPLSKLAYGTDYTVQWQMLTNAAAYPDKASATWTNITSATGTTCQIDVEQGAAYRAVITVKDTPIAKGSYEKIDQGTVGTADKNDGRQVYYSNILVAANAPATLTVNVNTSNTSDGYEGIVEGETVTIHTFTSGATGTTPISQLTVNIYEGKSPAAGATPVFTAEKANVNGHVSFDWNKDVTPGYYTLKVKATFTNGYDDKEITRTLIVRDNDYSFNVTGDNAVYNGKVQGLNVAVQNMGIENALAQKSVVVYYYTDEARTQQVEPTQAGTYYATVRLQESAYWTEKTFPATFTIKPREVSVVDLVAQAKVYDGTTNANIQEIVLNDATVDPATGLPTDGKGIIDGDSVYAVGTGYTSLATAGTAKLGVKDVSLKGDDAANYDLTSYSYTEDFNIQRSQVKGAIVSGRTYKYTGKDIKLAASDIYLIDQAGSQLTNYDVTYYYHNGDGVEQVSAMNKMGKYTVIARPEQDNYKGGATETVYVGTADNAGTLVTNAVSSLITISNTVELYGATTGVTVSATKGTATASYYYDGAWKDNAPTAAGRYLVKATVTNDGVTDTAYGIYTIVKARPEFTPTTDKSSMEYTSGRYDGAIGAGFVNGKSNDTAETYITYTGGTIQGVAYEAPTEVGKYIATVHVGETANYTAHEKQVAFEITPKALTITADDISRQQYGAYPDLTASFKGLATGGVAADTSLRDVQIQPELIDKSNYTNDASDQVGNNYKIIAVAALARNYTVSYVDGNMSVTSEDPKPYLEIRGMIENGDGATDLAYYGDVIQLYAYGNQNKTTNGDVYNTSSILAWSVTGPATITQDGLLTVTGVGDVTVTLTRGIGAQQIRTSLTFKAKKQEVKVVVPAEDKVYDGTTQDYTSTKTLSAVNAMGTNVFVGNGNFIIANNTRSDVGSQIVTGKVSDSIHSFQSETYGGLFTINVKNVSVTPNEISVIYGEALGTPGTPGTLGYSESGTVSGVPALTDGKAVSEREDYINLDVLDGYEILVAGRENENYNVKYVTDQTAPDVEVTAKALTIKTGTLNEQAGMTSGSLNPMGKYPVNGDAVASTASMGAANVRMYGEPNWVMDEVMDETLATLIDGDTLADLTALGDKLVKFNYNIGADANVKYDARTTFLSGKNKYDVETNDSMMAFKNYAETYTLGTQNIYQRPVTLTVPTGVTLTAYKPTIIDASGNVKTDVLLDLLLNNLEVKKYKNGTLEEGGLAELLKHTIKDLDIKIVSAAYSDSTKTITANIELGNKNYWTEDLNFTVKVDPTKIVAKYGPLGWTSASVTMVPVDEGGNEGSPDYVTGKVWYEIYVKDPSITTPKYSDYKGKTTVRKVEMIKGSSPGVYIANYDRLPAGEYVMFAIAEGYTIIE